MTRYWVVRFLLGRWIASAVDKGQGEAMLRREEPMVYTEAGRAHTVAGALNRRRS